MAESTEADRYLLKQIAAGDESGWSQLVARYHGRLLAFARRQLKKPGDAEDLVQEAFVAFLTHRARFDPTRSVETFLFTTLRRRIIDTYRGRATRSLSKTEREEIADIAKDKPNIDLTITFDYNSADISAKSLAEVQKLGRALTNPNLKGSTFLLAGHTDAAGGDSYNQQLSERRADSIKRYLVDNYSIAASDLVTVGYGKSKLKDPSHPLDEANRRVQVVNMQNNTTASK